MFLDTCCTLEIVVQGVGCITLVFSLILLFYVFCLPMNRIRQVEEVGFTHLKHGQFFKKNIKIARKLRKTGSSSKIFPNGWYVVLESRDLGPGEVRQVDALGLNLAVFRGESGEVFIHDAYCPHLGANLCSGGRVEDDCIRCPFHGWKFSGRTGECVDIPYSNKSIPKTAKLKKYIHLELNQLIYIWFHTQNTEPSWRPRVEPGVEDKSWAYQGRTEYYVNCSIQEIPENGADPSHLASVHKTGIVPGGGEPGRIRDKITSKICTHSWEADWKKTEEPHLSEIHLKHSLEILNRFSTVQVHVVAQQIGPSTVHLHFDTCLGRCLLMQYILPVEPLLQKLVHVLYTERSSWFTFLPPLAKVLLWGESLHLERDIRIWNSKMYLRSPILVAEDKYIQQFRRWYSQFYSTKQAEDNISENNESRNSACFKETTEW